MSNFATLATIIILPAISHIIASASAMAANRVEANRLYEFTFTSTKTYEHPFNDVTVDVLYSNPQGETLRVPAFWAGGNTWKVRYASPVVGKHAFISECSVTDDNGLHGIQGKVDVVPYEGENRLYRHGSIRIADDRRHFAHADGTPFFWLGDTWWMGLCNRLHWPDEFQTLSADRKKKGFNVIQIVAGLYPDMEPFDPRGDNEFGWPWTKDYTQINQEYFDFADQRLIYLADQGFVPCVVGAWGYHLPRMGTEKIKHHWRYLIARYGALPVVWVASGESNMPHYLTKQENKEQESALQKVEWTKVIRYIRDVDPFNRIITNHPSRSARDTVEDPNVLDFDMHQTGHRFRGEVDKVVTNISLAYAAEPKMPVISGESSYDALDLSEWKHFERKEDGIIPSSASRLMFWACLMNNGAAGSTYGANGIWQVNRRDKPYGPSPHGRSWGSISWDEAMNRPGSQQVALAKKLFEQYAWHRFEPHSEWATWDHHKLAVSEETPRSAKLLAEPYATGIVGKVRVIYVLDPLPILVQRLEPDVPYSASYFNPVTGQYETIGPVKASDLGTWSCSAPKTDQDWVLILEAPGAVGANEAPR